MGFFDLGLSDIVGGALKFFGGQEDRDNAAAMNAANLASQKEFAQNGIQWKVADATKAGISPLAALGASTTSFSPVTAFAESPLKSMGQDLSRAGHASSTESERDKAYEDAVKASTLKNMELKNDLLASQVRRATSAGTPPAAPESVPTTAQKADVSDKDAKPIRLLGKTLIPLPNTSSADHVNDQYDDAASEIWGAGTGVLAVADQARRKFNRMYSKHYSPYLDKWGRKMGQWFGNPN